MLTSPFDVGAAVPFAAQVHSKLRARLSHKKFTGDDAN